MDCLKKKYWKAWPLFLGRLGHFGKPFCQLCEEARLGRDRNFTQPLRTSGLAIEVF